MTLRCAGIGAARDPTRSPRRPRTPRAARRDRKSTRLNSSHANISYAVFCLKKKKIMTFRPEPVRTNYLDISRTSLTTLSPDPSLDYTFPIIRNITYIDDPPTYLSYVFFCL